jgi:hypothetical protein
MYDFSTSFVLCIWIYGNKNDDDDMRRISAFTLHAWFGTRPALSQHLNS